MTRKITIKTPYVMNKQEHILDLPSARNIKLLPVLFVLLAATLTVTLSRPEDGGVV